MNIFSKTLCPYSTTLSFKDDLKATSTMNVCPIEVVLIYAAHDSGYDSDLK